MSEKGVLHKIMLKMIYLGLGPETISFPPHWLIVSFAVSHLKLIKPATLSALNLVGT